MSGADADGVPDGVPEQLLLGPKKKQSDNTCEKFLGGLKNKYHVLLRSKICVAVGCWRCCCCTVAVAVAVAVDRSIRA